MQFLSKPFVSIAMVYHRRAESTPILDSNINIRRSALGNPASLLRIPEVKWDALYQSAFLSIPAQTEKSFLTVLA